MILNSAVIERYLIDGKTYTDTKEFIDALLACTDLVADVYVNGKKVASGLLNLDVNNNWIIGNVDERLSITNMDGSAYNINIVVHQLGKDEITDIIMTSTSPLNTFIDPGDCDADLYFSIMSTVPECTQRCYVPDSAFRAMGTNNITPKDFNECPADPTLPEPEPCNVVASYNCTNNTFELFIDGIDGQEGVEYAFTITSNGTVVEQTSETYLSVFFDNGGGYDPESSEFILINKVVHGAAVTVTVVNNSTGETIVDNVTAIVRNTATYLTNDDPVWVRFSVYDSSGNLLQCDPEETYSITVAVGGGKGEARYIACSASDLTELQVTAEDDESEDFAIAFNSLRSGSATASIAVGTYSGLTITQGILLTQEV